METPPPEEQKVERIAIHRPELAKTCFKEIARARRRDDEAAISEAVTANKLLRAPQDADNPHKPSTSTSTQQHATRRHKTARTATPTPQKIDVPQTSLTRGKSLHGYCNLNVSEAQLQTEIFATVSKDTFATFLCRKCVF